MDLRKKWVAYPFLFLCCWILTSLPAHFGEAREITAKKEKQRVVASAGGEPMAPSQMVQSRKNVEIRSSYWILLKEVVTKAKEKRKKEKRKLDPDKTSDMRIAVLDFTEARGTKEGIIHEGSCFGWSYANDLASVLTSFSEVKVIERNDLDKAIEALQLPKNPDLYDMKTFVDLGKWIGAEFFLTGDFQDLKKCMKLNGRLIILEKMERYSANIIYIEKDEEVDAMIHACDRDQEGKTPDKKTEGELKEKTKKETKEILELEAHMVAERNGPHGMEKVPITTGSILYSNDCFRICFKTFQRAHVYFLVKDSSGEAYSLFPHRKIQLRNPVQPELMYEIPMENVYFCLDDKTGIETIYILASTSPIDKLDKLLTSIEKSEDEKERKHYSKEINRYVKGISARNKRGISVEERIEPNVVRPEPHGSDVGSERQRIYELLRGMGLVVREIWIDHR